MKKNQTWTLTRTLRYVYERGGMGEDFFGNLLRRLLVHYRLEVFQSLTYI